MDENKGSLSAPHSRIKVEIVCEFRGSNNPLFRSLTLLDGKTSDSSNLEGNG